MSTMRAIITTPPGAAHVADVPLPRPAAGEVLVKVTVSDICPHDRPIMSGAYHRAGLITLPTVGLGWDVVGTIVEANGVPGFSPGQRVAGTVASYDLSTRALAEYVALPAAAITEVPAHVSDEAAVVSLISGLTAVQALDLIAAAPGTLLVTAAAGNVGAYLIPLAVQRGFTVTGFARNTDRAFVEGLGAHFTSTLEGSFDAVVDAAALGAAALELVREGGDYVGVHPGSEPAMTRGITVQAVEAEPSGSQLAQVLDLVAAGKTRPRVIREVDLAGAAHIVNAPAERGARGRYLVRV